MLLNEKALTCPTETISVLHSCPDRCNGQLTCWAASLPHATLQAHDWQAYQELLAKQKGPEGASEKYEVINRFLDDTEDYLHKLAGKVASVKLSQESSEAAAQAMAEARAQVCCCLLTTVLVHLRCLA